MLLCINCGKENYTDSKYCRYCGNYLDPVTTKRIDKRKFYEKLPAWVWILLAVAALAVFILSIMGSFWVLGNIEGVGSLLMFLLGAFSFGIYKSTPFNNDKILRAVAIGFYAVMGMSIDQTGNYLYNKPVEYCYCKDGSTLNRDVTVLNPTPGRTDLIQDYACIKNGEVSRYIPNLAVFGIRFLEYMILGYLFIALRWLRWKISP